MSYQVVNWVNSARNQTLPVKYKDVKQHPSDGVSPATVQSKVKLVQSIYKNADLSKAQSAAVYRDDDTREIDGLLGLPGQTLFFESHKTNESAGIDNVLSNMGRYMSGQRILFAGKKADAPVQPAAKQGLSLMA